MTHKKTLFILASFSFLVSGSVHGEDKVFTFKNGTPEIITLLIDYNKIPSQTINIGPNATYIFIGQTGTCIRAFRVGNSTLIAAPDPSVGCVDGAYMKIVPGERPGEYRGESLLPVSGEPEAVLRR